MTQMNTHNWDLQFGRSYEQLDHYLDPRGTRQHFLVFVVVEPLYIVRRSRSGSEISKTSSLAIEPLLFLLLIKLFDAGNSNEHKNFTTSQYDSMTWEIQYIFSKIYS